jgi:heme oxygenase
MTTLVLADPAPVSRLQNADDRTRGSVRMKLRDETHHLHIAIERAVDLPARLVSTAAYSSLLTDFFGYYEPLERRLIRAHGLTLAGLDLTSRLKTPLLKRDLAFFAIDDTHDPLPRCQTLPDVTDPADALGCLYVLEGSTLGGQITRRLVAESLGLRRADGIAFFSSYGDHVGRMWREFCGALEVQGAAAPAAERRMIDAAAATFETLRRWLARRDS